MAETYSLAVTGRRADSLFAVKEVTVGDSAGPDSIHQRAMSLNSQILCKNADGSQSYYTIDAERSIGTNLVLKAV